MDSDDAWARDSGPTFLLKESDEKKVLGGVCWKFNAWGGLYQPVHDNHVNSTIL